MTTRRDFLAVGLATSLLASCKKAAPAPTTPSGAPAWDAFRDEFRLSRDWIHLAGFLFASHPRRVREAIEKHRDAFDANPALYVEDHIGRLPDLAPIAAYMGVEPGDIALTDSTTMGLGVLYGGLPLKAGDEVITSLHDHFVTHEALRLATTRAGAKLTKVAMYDKPEAATASTMTAAIAKAITPATKVIAITWVHSSTGVMTPIKAIAEVVKAANAKRAQPILLCVDGVHAFGVDATKVGELGCDFFAAGTHKWMFGPRGTGVLWGRKELWPTLHPSIPDFGYASFMAWTGGKETPPRTADTFSPGGFHTFEHRWALAEAFELHRELGPQHVAARIRELNRQCKQGLAAMKHVTLHTPMGDDVSAGIITFEVAGMTPDVVVKKLHAKKIIASTTPYVVSYARLAPGLINSAADVDAALREIRALS
jgi:selenocysteine lyase/cysteine desulfurase